MGIRRGIPTLIGFRPLAGITVFRTLPPSGDTRWQYLFPSPGGDYGLSDESVVWLIGCAMLGFRPLAGITVFRTAQAVTWQMYLMSFPSPGGDYGLSDGNY